MSQRNINLLLNGAMLVYLAEMAKEKDKETGDGQQFIVEQIGEDRLVELTMNSLQFALDHTKSILEGEDEFEVVRQAIDQVLKV